MKFKKKHTSQVEISILLKPVIAEMTMSEIHAVMVGGFSTVAGVILAAFILFGVSDF